MPSLPVRPPAHAWDRMIMGWHVAFCLTVLVAQAYVLTGAGLAGRRIAATAVLVALGATYVATVGRGARRGGPAAAAYLLVAVVGTGLACSLDPLLAVLMFVVYPQAWLLAGSVARATAVAGLLTVASGAGFGSYYDWEPEALRSVVPQLLVGFAFSVGLGVWISRIIDQSRERGELLAVLEQTRQELGDAHHAQGVAAERERVAREVHDTLAQGFTSIVMLSQAATGSLERDPSRAADRLRQIEDVARDNLAEARSLVAAFAPPDLSGTTLAGAVQRLAGRVAQDGLQVDVQLSGPLHELGRDREVVLLRAVQEALTNVRRHARASSVVVRLVADRTGASVQVDDDGIGLGPRIPEGFGLSGMRGRVADAGGELDVASSPGSGTTVTVRLPALAGGA